MFSLRGEETALSILTPRTRCGMDKLFWTFVCGERIIWVFEFKGVREPCSCWFSRVAVVLLFQVGKRVTPLPRRFLPCTGLPDGFVWFFVGNVAKLFVFSDVA